MSLYEKFILFFLRSPSPICSHNRSIVSYDSKEKQSLNWKYDDANERKFGNGIKKVKLWLRRMWTKNKAKDSCSF
jgi:hypothetical protein